MLGVCSPPSFRRASTQHHFRTTFLSTQWPWRPLSLIAQRSAASPSQTAASHSPLVLPQPKTHSLSASSMQDTSALPGGGPTYPPSFRTTTSTSCCWRRLGCALTVTKPRSPTWLRLDTQSSPSRALHSMCHTPSTAFRHLPPNSVRFSYVTEGALFISAQLFTDAVSALRKVRVLIWLWKQPSAQART